MKYLEIAESAYEKAMDFIFPGRLYCICCGNIIDESRNYGLCDHCMTHIRWANDGKEIKLNDSYTLKLIRCAEYGIYERSIIFALKYNDHKYIADEIACIMKDRLELEKKDFDIIVPVPLSKMRQRERGYNHAELIGKSLGRKIDVKALDILERIRDTLPMKRLGPAERKRNIQGAITIRSDRQKEAEYIKGKDVLLIDDFFTTGSTAEECARALLKMEPRSITCLVFAARMWVR